MEMNGNFIFLFIYLFLSTILISVFNIQRIICTIKLMLFL